MDGRNPLKMPIGFDPTERPLLRFGHQPWRIQTVSWTWFSEIEKREKLLKKSLGRKKVRRSRVRGASQL